MNDVFRTKQKVAERGIDKYCKQSCITLVGKECISRHYFLISLFLWETTVYLHLIRSNTSITPLASPSSLTLVYHTQGLVSLREYLRWVPNHSAFFHELFSFVKYFKRLGFAHGNLHLDNVLVCSQTKGIPKFYVIDLVNSYIFDNPTSTIRRTSFIGEHDHPAKMDNLDYFDVYTLTVSLIQTESISKLHPIIKDTMNEYIPGNVLQLFNAMFSTCRGRSKLR